MNQAINNFLKRHNRVLKIAFSMFFILFLCGSTNAQDLKKDLIKVYEKFSDSSFEMEIKMKISHWDGSAPAVSKGKVKRKEDNYYSSFDGQVTLKNEEYTVLITERDKNMIYIVNQRTEGAPSGKEPLTMMKDTSLFKNVKLITADASGKIYEINQPQFGIKKMRLKISAHGILKEVKYYYERTEESPVKEVFITYSNVVFNPVFKTTAFSEKKYFKIVNGNAVLATAYNNYTITNGGYTN